MQVVILAEGYGARSPQESATQPKPMVAIGQPISRHIMKTYSHYGLTPSLSAWVTGGSPFRVQRYDD